MNAKRMVSKVLALVLIMGTCTQTPVGLAAKKATLARKSFSLNVGQKKKIVIKKKKKGAKYTYRSSSVKVAKVSKSGMVTARKSGKAMITVKEKIKKKTRKVGVVKVRVKKMAPVATPAVSPVPTPAAEATSVPTSTETPFASPTVAPTLDPNRDVYSKELFRLNVTETKLETVQGNTCKVDMQYFKGTASGDYFSGSVYKESSNVTKTFKDGKKKNCARFILSGKDNAGNTCKIFIQDEGTEENGKTITKPVILTNSKALAWMETADIQGRLSVNEKGEKVITYLWNESNTEPVAPPAIVKPDTTHKYTKEIFTFFIDIGATDSVTGSTGKASMIHFGGRGECDNFNGKVVADSVDTRLKYTGKIETLSARYILEGTDAKGNPCRMYVENNGIDNNGMTTEPVIITDCPDYAWVETAPLHGTVSWETGLTIHMWTTEDAQK